MPSIVGREGGTPLDPPPEKPCILTVLCTYSFFCMQTTYSIKRICACEVLEERSGQKTVFRIVRSSKDGGFKNIDFEAPTSEASKTHTTTTVTKPTV